MPLKIGEEAPDFELDSHLGHKVRVSSFRNIKNVVVFHPLAWTPVCSNQMQNYESDKKWFDSHETHILALSVDAVPAKVGWAKSLGGISYDLLSDFHPKGLAAERYGVTRDGGITERAIFVFVVGKSGTIVFAKAYNIPTLPDNAEIRQALEMLEKTIK
ncbi:MAG: redoxin domain-containing protein [Vicinamibacterales bacterium]